MKKLKILLHSKLILSLFILITLIYVYLTVTNNYFKSKYNEEITNIEGIITSIKIDGNKVSLIIKNEEEIVVNYYTSSESELNIFKTYQLGDKLKVEGVIQLPSDNTVFYLFNYRKYLLSKKIHYIMSASSIQFISKNDNLFYSIKNTIIDRVNKLGSKEYLKAFLIGDNSSIDNDVRASYQTNGISHLFALSGLHVTIFSSIILFILNKIIKNKKLNYFLVSIFLIFYMFLTGLSPSIIRATLFFVLLNLNSSLNIGIKTINLYIIMVCVVLLINPYNIYNNGFLFSYIISFYLIVFNKIINRHKNYFMKLLITSIMSSIISIPIMINSYFSVNLVSFIYNLFYVPFVTFIVFPLSLITLICPLFDGLLKICINILENSSLYLSHIKYFTIILRHIPLIIFILYYLLITFIFIMIKRKKYIFFLLLVIALFIHTNYNVLNDTVYLTMIDVGQGDCILLVMPHNKGNILIDTGGKVSFDSEKWKMRSNTYSIAIDTIIPYLKAEGIKKIDYLILSHGDFDHAGEAVNLVNNFKVEKVIFNCGPYNDLEQELIKVLNKKGIPYYSCIKKLNIDKTKLYFLQTKIYNNENDNSNVVYTEINGYKFMFMGDASSETEKEILYKYNLSNIDVLKAGHHGSKTSSSKEFIDKINPKYSIISVGKNNRYGHPNKEVLTNLENSEIYRTDINGSVMFKIRNSKLQIETCAP